ncbi:MULTISPECIES: hypothetical protein [Paenibacillus]|uniref:DUF6979 family protein n=1 Tax=Paenibacillus TaxID=44249 RepID=UPI00096BE3E6|nr:hypothetical protein [Paenibacillus odorifer]OMD48466.1 hypothetical protein BSK55_29120 [Paenibacillus odorifer]OME48734.1 hypothetical protein BSK61_24450 [Paenibacillus odorifer]
MNKYGVVALKAVDLLRMDEQSEPLAAWTVAASEVFRVGSSSQRKGCPKNAFLGLCEAGMVEGIQEGYYVNRSTSQKNKGYAIRAVQLLKEKPELADDKVKLWKEVMNGVEMSHNSQMDVVLSLWNNKLIVGN